MKTSEALARLETKVEGIDGKTGILGAKVEQLHGRIFNGMAKEIRDEVASKIEAINDKMERKISSVQTLVIGILIAVLLSFAGIIIEARVSSNQASKAIIDLGQRLTSHILMGEPNK